MSIIGYLGGNLPADGPARSEDLKNICEVPPVEGEELVGRLKRAGGVREVYERVEDYDPVLRRHCRL